jgi:hypothetical protein
MLRLIFILIFLFLAIIAGSSIALWHFFGWKGLIALPFILIAVLLLGKKVGGYLFKRVALSLFEMKSRVLRGASMTVHSVTPVAQPKHEGEVEEADEDEESDEAEDFDDAEPDSSDEVEEPKEYFAVDVTITPRNGEANALWEAGEFILLSERISSLAQLEEGDKELGTVEQVKVWNGSEWGPDDPGKYPGEQRLLLTFAVKPNTSTAWLNYYNEPIGTLPLPRWQVASMP